MNYSSDSTARFGFSFFGVVWERFGVAEEKADWKGT